MKIKINNRSRIRSDVSLKIVLILKYYVAGIFVFTGLGKLAAYSSYSYYVEHFSYLPNLLKYLALAVPYLELFVGLVLFRGVYKFFGLSVAVFHFILMTTYWYYFSRHSVEINYPTFAGDFLKGLTVAGHLIFSVIMLIISICCLVFGICLRRQGAALH